MSYNGSGTFQINTSGQPVVAGTVISSTAFNALTADLATGLSTAITKDGQTTTTARIPFAQGISSTLTTDSSSVSTGSIITAGGIGAAKAAYIGTTLNVGGASTFTGAIAVDSVTDSSSTTTGSIQTDGGLGVAKAVYVGTTANVAGAVTLQSTLGVTGVATFSAAPIYSSLTASSAVATDASKGLVSVTNTGTGNNVLATSPTLITPALGTPSALVLTNATGLPTAALPAGSVLQVTQTSTTSTVTATNVNVLTFFFERSFVPLFTSSRIMIMTSVGGVDNGGSGRMAVNLVYNTTSGGTTGTQAIQMQSAQDSSGTNGISGLSGCVIYSGGTFTAGTTYYFKYVVQKNDTSTTWAVGQYNSDSSITVMEIAA